MTQVDFLDKLKELTSNEDLLSVSREVSELKGKFEDFVLEEERKFQVAQIEAQEKGEEIPELDTDFGKEEFYTILDAYKSEKKKIKEEIKASEEANLQTKKSLIAKLKDVIENEENIGAAFAALKEVQEKWKTIGDIPRAKRNDVQTEYSRLLEDFFYNIKIYKELKDHDFHRNKQLKEEVVQKLKTLNKVESIKEVENQLKDLQNDWEDIGPVPNEDWEVLKDSYWTEVRSIYERINRFYEDRREAQKENIAKKEALVDKTASVVAKMDELNDVPDWDNATKEVLDIQKEWKTIGYGPKKENDEVWSKFRSTCDQFFNAKKEFFDKVHEKYDVVAEKKKELIEKAETLKSSVDWKDTSAKLINLQKEWKKLGHSGKRHEQKLWKKFRGACDEFFNARQTHFAEKDKEFETNLTEKEALIKTIERHKLPENKNEALELLKSLTAQFAAIGHVPMKQKDKVYKAYKAAMDKHYSSLKLEGKEKEKTMFSAKLETMKADPNAHKQFRMLRSDLRRDIDRIKKEIIQLENNLGFFANSKGANALKDEVEKKIQHAHSKIEEIKTKLKLIPNE